MKYQTNDMKNKNKRIYVSENGHKAKNKFIEFNLVIDYKRKE